MMVTKCLHQGGDDNMGVDGDKHIRKLVRGLQSPEPLTRLKAGWLLGRMGPAAQEAVPALLDLLRQGTAREKKLAAWTLGYVGGPPEVARALRDALRDGDEGVRLVAASALQRAA
jgi:HEAT repeat protein